MTATDVLRRLLDERGVEYTEDRGYREFFWDFGEYGKARASGIGTRGLVQMIVTGITPEQAIAATLGTGTCKRVFYEPTGVYVCSECGRGLSKKLDKYCYLHYCPNCGAKVIEPTTNDVDVEVEQ